MEQVPLVRGFGVGATAKSLWKQTDRTGGRLVQSPFGAKAELFVNSICDDFFFLNPHVPSKHPLPFYNLVLSSQFSNCIQIAVTAQRLG